MRAAQEMVELIDLVNFERQAAEKPQIRIGIGIATRVVLGERFDVEPLGPVPFKGKAAAVDVFSVDPARKP